MASVDGISLRAKSRSHAPSGVRSDPETDIHRQSEEVPIEPPIRCATCLEPVTQERHRVVVMGHHTHVFANPYGIVFEIGCFDLAPGCRSIGPASEEFTWFPGFSWRIAVCGGCEEHLGWCFTSESQVFWALILDRLV